MAATIAFAQGQNEQQVMGILGAYGMGIPGDVEELLTVQENEEITAVAKIAEFAEGRFFLEVIGVKDGKRSQGAGKLLLGKILANPWECCRYAFSEQENNRDYTVSTLARGYALGFYEKMGFQACTSAEIPEWYRDQCEECPERSTCEPMPMIYSGGERK
ncbi:acetyltransferase [Desulfitobacterium hafniense]|uniref:Acetyltransferase n=1 Tax=Desulfitobacterium hafniense TaxID=49338 RepID=A0A0W1JJ42_DESHA|nr:GNAT family N-acetyltransferase [Desulfitobacterium hafniense]KTE91506.1 acetyltransferase [Desulfitobacterium hafniense]